MFRNNKENTARFIQSFGDYKIDGFNFDLIGKYFERKDNSGAYQVLSDKTVNDLDINDLFTFVDRTSSRVGQQYIYNQIRAISTEPISNNEELLISDFVTNQEFRLAVQMLLEKLSKEEAYYICSLFQTKHIQPPKWYFLIPMLSFISLLSILLIPVNGKFLLLTIGTFIINAGIHYWNKKNLFEYLHSLPQLLQLNKVAGKLFSMQKLKALSPGLSKCIKTINEVKLRMAFFNVEAKLQGDMQAIFWGLFEIIKTLFLLEPMLLFGILNRLNSRKNEIEEVFTFIGKTDMLLSIASLRAGKEQTCKPSITSSHSAMNAKDLYHPLIVDCVKNDINLHNKSILLTGSNMSGKTSFIRTVGVNVITGLTLNTCFANNISFSKMKIHSAIRISDDLLNDKSYYFEEVLSVKQMLDESNSGSMNLFLLDEIFKGTNTIERISAGKAVLSELSRGNNIVFVSTHDIELADLLANEYNLYHFSEIIGNETVDFDYKLKEGKLKNRNAIRILELNNYPPSVINEAISLSRELDEFKVEYN